MSENSKTGAEENVEREYNKDTEKSIDLDDILVNELGQFGCFQLRCMLLISIPIIVSAFMSDYIFSASYTPHRCRIPECGEDNKNNDFEPEWILNAIPETRTGFASCERYAPMNDLNGTLNDCPISLFDQVTIGCEEFVYSRSNTVVYEFDLACQEWLRALAGTLYSVGTLLVLPFTGLISDRFGRRVALVINVFNMAVLGLIRAFSVNYTMFLLVQIIQTTLGGAIFSCAYVIATELVGPKYRVVASAVSSSMYAVGQVILGFMAWLIDPWRYLIIALHAPCLLLISYYWILPESVRWLLSKKKYVEAIKLLENVARANKTQISDQSKNTIVLSYEKSISVEKKENGGLVSKIVQSPVLLRRVCTTPIWWITSTFVYYGLSINSTTLSDTMHLNFILTCAIEIPGYITAVLILDRVGRKFTLSSGFFFSAACNIGFIFIPDDLHSLRLTLYLLGKFGISMTLTSLYLFTSELYPTEFRHSLLAFSSMIGRIGSISAPFTPVLMEYWVGAPSAMFAVLAVISGLLVLTQPETLGTKLPDTLAEAEALGVSQSTIIRR